MSLRSVPHVSTGSRPFVPAVHDMRTRRAHRAAVARAILEGPLAGAPEAAGVDWAELAELPGWCLWPAGTRLRLVRVVGALFAAPGMRLWIDGRRIEIARTLIGTATLARVMACPTLPMQAPAVPPAGDLQRLFDGAGRAVLLGSLGAAWMRAVAGPLLPMVDARSALCPPAIARPLVEQALALVAEIPSEAS
ncbi:MAG: hypothetical protein ACJ8GJ_22740 [Vitreoscilla sp.]